MIDASVIIFFATLIAILVMFVHQGGKLKRGEIDEATFSSKDLSYENFRIINDRVKKLWLKSIHALAIMGSKVWARITHQVTTAFHKGVKHVENQLIKHEQKNGADSDVTDQSVFLTTIKTYKKEIQKLQGKVEEELPRPRVTEEQHSETVAISEKIDTIDESRPE
jgi:hypothetical protein